MIPAIYLCGPSDISERSRMNKISNDLAMAGHNVLAAWLNWSSKTHPNEQQNWRVCINQIQRCCAVVCVSPVLASVKLRGALWEIGYGQGLGRPTYILHEGKNLPSVLGTWIAAPETYVSYDIKDLLQRLEWAKL